MPIDHETLENDQYSLIEISGGCICCTLKGDIIDALKSIAENDQADRILIEPSGIFLVEDMFEILDHKWLRARYVLNGIYTVVDGHHFMIDKMRHAPFFESQLRYASHIIISKVALHSEKSTDRVLEGLDEFNISAERIAIPFEDLDVQDLRRIFSSDVSTENFVEEKNDFDDPTQRTHDGMVSVGIKNIKHLNQKNFDGLILALNRGDYGHVIRIKGYIEIEKTQYLLNYVSGTYELVRVKEQENRLTIIGEGLDVQKLRRNLMRIKIKAHKL